MGFTVNMGAETPSSFRGRNKVSTPSVVFSITKARFPTQEKYAIIIHSHVCMGGEVKLQVLNTDITKEHVLCRET